jgi:hypothetical protein
VLPGIPVFSGFILDIFVYLCFFCGSGGIFYEISHDPVRNSSETDLSVKRLCWAPGVLPQNSRFNCRHLCGPDEHLVTRPNTINWYMEPLESCDVCMFSVLVFGVIGG